MVPAETAGITRLLKTLIRNSAEFDYSADEGDFGAKEAEGLLEKGRVSLKGSSFARAHTR